MVCAYYTRSTCTGMDVNKLHVVHKNHSTMHNHDGLCLHNACMLGLGKLEHNGRVEV